MRALALVILVWAACSATTAHAHPEHSVEWNMLSGFIHPLRGWDHVLAMLAAGVWAAQLGGRALIAMPAAFSFSMLLGAISALAGYAWRMGEFMSLLGLPAIGLPLAYKLGMSALLAAIYTAFFAFFHGWEHAVQIPSDAHSAAYFTGVLAATLLIYAAGVATRLGAMKMERRTGEVLTRLGGAMIAAAGAIAVLV